LNRETEEFSPYWFLLPARWEQASLPFLAVQCYSVPTVYFRKYFLIPQAYLKNPAAMPKMWLCPRKGLETGDN